MLRINILENSVAEEVEMILMMGRKANSFLSKPFIILTNKFLFNLMLRKE
jgi:hypothetical protein